VPAGADAKFCCRVNAGRPLSVIREQRFSGTSSRNKLAWAASALLLGYAPLPFRKRKWQVRPSHNPAPTSSRQRLFNVPCQVVSGSSSCFDFSNDGWVTEIKMNIITLKRKSAQQGPLYHMYRLHQMQKTISHQSAHRRYSQKWQAEVAQLTRAKVGP